MPRAVTGRPGGRPAGYRMSESGKAAIGAAVSAAWYRRNEKLAFCDELIAAIKAGASARALRAQVAEFEEWESDVAG